MDFYLKNKKYDIKVKHLSEYYDEYIDTKNIDVFEFYLDDDGVWRRTTLKWLFDFLVEKEEYEKCNILKEVIKKYYVADKIKQIELNIKLRLKKIPIRNKYM
jgi:hypothetical protein